uniref:Uncharacterized protein n=1 Tax=Rhizophora mucronata TaxID=61149 RepID=A0A2P2K505_RHIMU
MSDFEFLYFLYCITQCMVNGFNHANPIYFMARLPTVTFPFMEHAFLCHFVRSN